MGIKDFLTPLLMIKLDIQMHVQIYAFLHVPSETLKLTLVAMEKIMKFLLILII